MWDNSPEYRFQPGMLFVGRDPKHGYEMGISTKRHAVTIAGTRSGKGAAVIIPNLLKWPHNALVIDPKGEAAEATAEHREREFGQAVHILDPFGVSPTPGRMAGRFNPLEAIDPESFTAREDVGVLADGLVKRDNPEADFWYNGGVDVLAGLMAYVIENAPPESRSLLEVRQLLTLPKSEFQELAQELATSEALDGLPRAAAARMTTSDKEADHFISIAQSSTSWLDSRGMKTILGGDSTFQLTDLKTKPCTVYLVLPPEYLEREHSRFLRLFVRAAINAMAKGGTKGGRECLFILDEVFSLGRLDAIATGAGLLPGFGVKLWPFLQDINQLVSLYGREGAETILGNSGLHQFFGNMDVPTLQYISVRLGVKTVDEVPLPPAAPSGMGALGGQAVGGLLSASMSGSRHTRGAGAVLSGIAGGLGQMASASTQADYQTEMAEYQREMATVGTHRIPPDKVAQLVQLKDDDVADGSICFVHGSNKLLVRLAPFFRQYDEIIVPSRSPRILQLSAIAAFFLLYILHYWRIISGLVFIFFPTLNPYDSQTPIYIINKETALISIPIVFAIFVLFMYLYMKSKRKVLNISILLTYIIVIIIIPIYNYVYYSLQVDNFSWLPFRAFVMPAIDPIWAPFLIN